MTTVRIRKRGVFFQVLVVLILCRQLFISAFMSSPLHDQKLANTLCRDNSLCINSKRENNGAWEGSDSTMPKEIQDIWNSLSTIEVQAASLRTCSFDKAFERVQVFLKTEGNPMNATIELWQGQDRAPQKIQVHVGNGERTPFRSVVETPGGFNSIAIHNGDFNYPVTAGIESSKATDFNGPIGPAESLIRMSNSITIEGGTEHIKPFGSSVESVQIGLKTDGRPLKATIELLNAQSGKQTIETYCEDGEVRPFYIVIELTPAVENRIRIVNTSTEEFPLVASIEPHRMAY